MRIEFEFDKTKVEALGYSIEQVEVTLQQIFAEKHLRYSTSKDIIICTDNDHRDDYGYMWSIILRLMDSPWFIETATACRWYDEEDEDEEPEDVLAQAYKFTSQ